jgi:hypothetical protein
LVSSAEANASASPIDADEGMVGTYRQGLMRAAAVAGDTGRQA